MDTFRSGACTGSQLSIYQEHRMHRMTSGTLSLLFCAATYLPAQAVPSDTAKPARKVTAAQLRLATELLPLMNTEAVVKTTIEATFDEQIKQQPLMAPFRITMQQWVDKYFTVAEFSASMAQIYAEEFTESELRQLVAFYKTPVGAKVAAITPVLAKRGGEVGARMAQAHMSELQEMIQKRAAELQANPPPSK